MTIQQNNTVKFNPFLLSNQVKEILKKKGFTSLFNYTDYNVFKEDCKDAFNIAIAISNRFINEAQPQQNDFNNYIF